MPLRVDSPPEAARAPALREQGRGAAPEIAGAGSLRYREATEEALVGAALLPRSAAVGVSNDRFRHKNVPPTDDDHPPIAKGAVTAG